MFFQFAPGIPYSVQYPKFVIPKMDYGLLVSLLADKKVTVICLGGFIETYLSLIAAEAISRNCHNVDLYWSGTHAPELVEYQGLMERSAHTFERAISEQYPVPIFFDKRDNRYFDPFYQYWKFNPVIPGALSRTRRPKPPLEQIALNILFPWDVGYLPTMRKMPKSSFMHQKQNITIIPNTSLSKHQQTTLPWSNANIRAFSKLVMREGYNVTILNSQKDNPFYDCGQILQFNMHNLFNSIQRSVITLAYEIDYLMLACIISNSRTLSNPVAGRYNLKHIPAFLNKHNAVEYDNMMENPIYIFERYFKR